jgi:hypothetical protein
MRLAMNPKAADQEGDYTKSRCESAERFSPTSEEYITLVWPVNHFSRRIFLCDRVFAGDGRQSSEVLSAIDLRKSSLAAVACPAGLLCSEKFQPANDFQRPARCL